MEGVADVPHPRWLEPRIDGENVEAYLPEAGQSAGGQDLRGGPGNAALLASVDRSLCRAEALAPSQPNLDEAKGVAVEGYQIDLGVTQVDVPSQNPEALVLEEGLRDVLSTATQSSRVAARR